MRRQFHLTLSLWLALSLLLGCAPVATPDTAEALGVYAGAPLLEVRRIALCSDERVVQYIRALYRPELYHIEIAMTRKVVPGGSLWSAQEEVG